MGAAVMVAGFIVILPALAILGDWIGKHLD